MPSLLAILGIDGTQFSAGLDKAKNEAHSKGSDIGSALGGKIAAGLTAAAIALAAKKQFDEISALADKAKEIKFGASRLSVGEDRFQDLQYAAEKGRTSIEAIYGAYRKLAVGAQEALGGNKELIAHFNTLGISLADLRDKTPDELFRRIAQHMDGAAVSGAELAAVIKTMGKSADELMPALRNGLFSGYNPFKLSKDDLEVLTEWKKNTGIFKEVFGAMKNQALLSSARNLEGLFGGAAGWLRKQFGIQGKSEVGSSGLADSILAEAEAAKTAEDEKKKALQEEEKQRERLQHLMERQMELNQRFFMEGRNNAQKLAALEEHRKKLLEETFDLTTEKGRADAQERNTKVTETDIEMQKLLNGELQSLQKTRPDVNSLQRIGAFAGDRSGMESAVKNIERHVADIATRPRERDTRTPGGF